MTYKLTVTLVMCILLNAYGYITRNLYLVGSITAILFIILVYTLYTNRDEHDKNRQSNDG